ncbi:MAG TPA: translocation/assembly module TamB domain-containing protein [Gemmatimonadales bacterium]
MRGGARVAAWIAAGVVGLLVLVVVAVLVLTNTDWGREQVRRQVVAALNDIAHGEVAIGRLEGNLLEGFTALDVSITDSAGAPLVTADTLRTRFDLTALLDKRIVLRDVLLVNPLVVLDQKPGEEWNFRRIFPGDTTAKDSLAGPGWGDWLLLEDVVVRSGRVVVRLPWEPDSGLTTQALRDSAAAAATDPQSRLNVVKLEDRPGYQTVYDFQHIDARFPTLRIADPEYDARLFEVASLSSDAYPFRPPAARIRDLRGTFRLTEDSVWFSDVGVRFPDSQLTGSGTMLFDGRTELALRGSRVATADLQWLYPRLPEEGAGRLDFGLLIDGDTAAYTVRDAHLEVEDATLAGDLGLVFIRDTIGFRDTDLRVSNLRTALVERLAPGVDVPRTGTLSGRAAVEGTIVGATVPGLRLDADLSFDDAATGRSRVSAIGRVAYADGDVSASDLRVTLRPVQVALAREAMPDLPVGGTLSGTATVNGSTGGRLIARFDLTHDGRDGDSRVAGRAAIRRSPNLLFDVDADLLPLSLATVGRFAPGIGLRGSARGPLHVEGSPRDLDFSSRLALSDGGFLDARGSLDMRGRQPAYVLDARTRLLNANAVVARAPRTSITGTVHARGSGFDPATMRATVAADLAETSVDTVAIDSATVRMAIGDGLATVDSLRVIGRSTLVTAEGTFGLRADREGTLTYRVAVDSLSDFHALIAGAPDTVVQEPRPRTTARALAAARADSARVAQETMVERMATGAPGPQLAEVTAPEGIPADSVAGSLYAAGVLRGNLERAEARGRAAVLGLVARGNVVRRGRAEYAWVDGLTPAQAFVVGAKLDSVQAAGFALDSVDARLAYKGEEGTADVTIVQEDSIDYRARANFRLALDESEITFQQLALRFHTTTWEAQYPGAVRWGKRGIFVDSLDLRAGEGRRIFAYGLIPTEGEADLRVQVSGFQIADAVAMLQGDIEARGLVSLDATMTGTAAAPVIRGTAGVTEGQYRAALLPDTRATFDYHDQALGARALLMRRNDSTVVATAEGVVPLNLALRTDEPRVPDRPLVVNVDADSLPLGLVTQFTDVVSNLDGRAAGGVRVRGTLRDPQVVGGLSLTDGTVTVVPTGMTVRDMTGRIRMLRDTVVIDSIVGYNTGRLLVRGGIGIREITAPSFDLYLVANDARVLDNEQGRINANAGIAMRGPFDGVYVSGAARITEGVITLPEAGGKNVIAADDPALFRVVDTSIVAEAELLPAQSALMENLRVDVNLGIDRDTWVRGRDANVEIFTPEDLGPLEISVDRRQNRLALRGVVSTERGEYNFLSKRFEVDNGSVTFLGNAELNPLLQVTGHYEVRLASQQALTIRILIGGTLQSPQLSLESDAQPPLAQSDLISYLAFGRTSSSLLQLEGSGLSSGNQGSLVGALGGVASQRLGAIALGAAVDELERQTTRSLGVDVVNITPAEVSLDVLDPFSNFDALIRGTEIELGRYFNERTFGSFIFRPSMFAGAQDGTVPGIRLQYRFRPGFRLDTTFEGRYLAQEPTLEDRKQSLSTAVFGVFLIREWGW